MGDKIIYVGDPCLHNHENTMFSYCQSLTVRWGMVRGPLKTEVCTILPSFLRTILEGNFALSGMIQHISVIKHLFKKSKCIFKKSSH